MMMSYLEGRSLRDLWELPKLEECSLNIVKTEDSEAEIKLSGDISFQD